jgi:hypothetical protein
MTQRFKPSFTSTLWRYPGVGGWVFAIVPEKYSPPVTHAWGRTRVIATVDGNTWKTSVWRGKDCRTLLAVPKKIRGTKDDGDSVRVRLEFLSL